MWRTEGGGGGNGALRKKIGGHNIAAMGKAMAGKCRLSILRRGGGAFSLNLRLCADPYVEGDSKGELLRISLSRNWHGAECKECFCPSLGEGTSDQKCQLSFEWGSLHTSIAGLLATGLLGQYSSWQKKFAWVNIYQGNILGIRK